MICSRRLYKGNTYEICLPLTDTGVTLVRFYTRGDVIIEKEPEISGDSMCFSFTEEEIASLEDGVLRYEIVTEYETVDTNSPYVIATPGDYSGSTLDDLLEDAFDSGYTAGQEDCSGGTCEHAWQNGYSSGYTDGRDSVDCSPFYDSGVTDGYRSGYTSGHTDGFREGYASGATDGWKPAYDSGFTDGVNSVECSGYTQEDLDAAYASGWSAGYDSGITDCSGSPFEGIVAYPSEIYDTVGTGVTCGVSISSSTAWYADFEGMPPIELEPWVSFSPTAGTGDATMQVTINPDLSLNPTGVPYDGNIILHQEGSGNSFEIYVYQEHRQYDKMPLIFEIISGGTILWKSDNSSSQKTIQAKVNQGEWTAITSTVAGTPINVSDGDLVYLIGDNATYCTIGSGSSNFNGSTAIFNVKGNTMSLLYGEDFENKTALRGEACLAYLFKETNVVDARNMVLPAQNCTRHCYQMMFSGCSMLTDAPALPAIGVAGNCYYYMFANCTSLTGAPSISATAASSYQNSTYTGMFRGCSNLEIGPDLLWESINTNGRDCQYMFTDCRKLRQLKCLASGFNKDVAQDFFVGWMSGVASSGTFIKHPDQTWTRGVNGIPTNWTIEDAQI